MNILKHVNNFLTNDVRNIQLCIAVFTIHSSSGNLIEDRLVQNVCLNNSQTYFFGVNC